MQKFNIGDYIYGIDCFEYSITDVQMYLGIVIENEPSDNSDNIRVKILVHEWYKEDYTNESFEVNPDYFLKVEFI